MRSEPSEDGGRAPHVLVLPSWYPTCGSPRSGTFFRDQAVALRARGVRVGVVAVIARSLLASRGRLRHPPRQFVDEDVPTHTVEVVNVLPRVPHGQLRLHLHAGRSLYAEYVATHGVPDLLHAHSCLFGGALARDLCHANGVRYVVTEHSSDFMRDRLPGWKLAVSRQVLIDAAAVVTVSPALGASLASALDLDGARFRWIPNLVADAFFDVPVRDARPPRVRFVSVGRLDANKGYDDLVEAFASRFRDADAELVLVGAGPEAASLRARVASLGIATQVRMTGALTPDHVRRELAEAHVFVLPSHHETFGVALAEALAMGLPAVATHSGGPASIVDERTGVLVPSRDATALAGAMAWVGDHLDRYSPHAIRAACRERFGADAVCEALTSLYRQCLS